MGGEKCPASGWKGNGCTVVLGAQDLKTDTQSLWNKWGSLRHRSQQKRRQFHACPAPFLPSSQYLGFRESEWVCACVWVWRAFEEFSGFSSAVWNVWGETRCGKAKRSCYLRFKDTPKEYWALCSNAGWTCLVCRPMLGGQPERLEINRDVYHSWKGYGQRSQLCLKPHYSKYGPPKGGISSPVPEPASTFQKDLPVYLKSLATDYSNSPSVLCIKSIFSNCDSYQSQVEGICSISG